MPNNRFSPKVKEIISHSREEALKFGHDYIGTEHLLLGVLKEPSSLAVRVLQSLNVDAQQLTLAIEDSIHQNTDNLPTAYNIGNLPLTRQAEKVLKVTFLEAKLLKSELIGTEHILLSVLKHKDNLAARVLMQFDVTYDVFKTELEYVGTEINPDITADMPPEFEDEDEGRGEGGEGNNPSRGSRSKGKSHTPVLDNFGRDISKLAEEDKLDPIIGREVEIERVSQILSRRKKNNPILIGEPGVGKTAVVEGLALRIHQRKVSRTLFNKRIVMLDLAALVAGTKYRGQFEAVSYTHLTLPTTPYV